MLDAEAQILKSPPESLRKLARVSVNQGQIELHILLACLLGRNFPDESFAQLRQIMARAPKSLLRQVADDLELPFEHLAEVCMEQFGIALTADA